MPNRQVKIKFTDPNTSKKPHQNTDKVFHQVKRKLSRARHIVKFGIKPGSDTNVNPSAPKPQDNPSSEKK